MKRVFYIFLMMFFYSTGINSKALAVESFSIGTSYNDFIMDLKDSIYSPPTFKEKLPELKKDFIDLSYFIGFKPLNLLSENELFFLNEKKSTTSNMPMNATPSVYNVSLNSNKVSFSPVSSIEQLVKNNPYRVEFIYSLALKYKEQKKYTEALNETERALNINPNYALGHFLRGDILREMNEYKEATKEYMITTQINPYCTDAYFNIGKIMEKYNRPDLALNYYKQAQQTNKNDVEIRNLVLKLSTAGKK